jgi:hypothetical protein
MSDITIILLITKGHTMWCGNLKGLSHDRGWCKSAENFGASPFKTELPIETTFTQVYLAGQSL